MEDWLVEKGRRKKYKRWRNGRSKLCHICCILMFTDLLYREWKKTEFPKEVLYTNLETTRLRGRPRIR